MEEAVEVKSKTSIPQGLNGGIREEAQWLWRGVIGCGGGEPSERVGSSKLCMQ